jgi:Tfp pilus assembly protein PilP
MKRVAILFTLLAFLGAGVLAAQPKTGEKALPAPKTEVAQTQAVTPPATGQLSSYNPEGRRDPFKNLMAGRDVKEKTGAEGLMQLSVGDMTLIGLLKYRGKLTAIVTGPQGFPFNMKVGDAFADGYVLSIGENQVVFRQTKERGLPLMRPRDIVKEINPEER